MTRSAVHRSSLILVRKSGTILDLVSPLHHLRPPLTVLNTIVFPLLLASSYMQPQRDIRVALASSQFLHFIPLNVNVFMDSRKLDALREETRLARSARMSRRVDINHNLYLCISAGNAVPNLVKEISLVRAPWRTWELTQASSAHNTSSTASGAKATHAREGRGSAEWRVACVPA